VGVKAFLLCDSIASIKCVCDRASEAIIRFLGRRNDPWNVYGCMYCVCVVCRYFLPFACADGGSALQRSNAECLSQHTCVYVCVCVCLLSVYSNTRVCMCVCVCLLSPTAGAQAVTFRICTDDAPN